MSQTAAVLARIEELKKEIATLQAEALRLFQEERRSLTSRVATIDAELAELIGPPPEKRGPIPESELPGKSIPLQELKALLEVAPDKTLNIRKEGLQLANIKTLARVNPHLLRLGGKGAWPTVTMLK
jgi:hypothetical protein